MVFLMKFRSILVFDVVLREVGSHRCKNILHRCNQYQFHHRHLLPAPPRSLMMSTGFWDVHIHAYTAVHFSNFLSICGKIKTKPRLLPVDTPSKARQMYIYKIVYAHCIYMYIYAHTCTLHYILAFLLLLCNIDLRMINTPRSGGWTKGGGIG